MSRKSGTINPGRCVQPLMWVLLSQIIPQAFTMIFISHNSWNVTQGVLASGKFPMNPEVLSGDMISAANWWWMIALAVIGHAIPWGVRADRLCKFRSPDCSRFIIIKHDHHRSCSSIYVWGDHFYPTSNLYCDCFSCCCLSKRSAQIAFHSHSWKKNRIGE